MQDNSRGISEQEDKKLKILITLMIVKELNLKIWKKKKKLMFLSIISMKIKIY